MGKLKGLLLLLLTSALFLYGCKGASSSYKHGETFTYLEIRNNSANVGYSFVNSMTVGDTTILL